MDRDEIDTFVQDDHVVIGLDTFNDERRAFQFRVNPLGVQADAVFSETDGIEDFSFDLIWDSAGRIADSGYVIEIAIPLNQLRFPTGGGEMTWGVDLGRSYPRSNRHRIANTPRPRDVSCVLCTAAKVTGFSGVEPGRNLILTPTLTANRTDRQEDFPEGDLVSGGEDFDPGFSVRWGVTPNMTLSGTVNPDFSQVEADVAQLDVNQRFALFFPEKRPFFLEGVDTFSTLIDAVFTRTVVDPDWGAKLTGKQGKHTLGLFATRDKFNSFIIPGRDSSDFASLDQEVDGQVLRYRRDVGKGSTLGLIYTGRESDDYHNRVGGVDGFLRFSDTDTINFQYLVSDTLYPVSVAQDFGQPAEAFDDDALEILYSHQDRNWYWFARWRDFGPEFRADFGFEPQVDIQRGALVLGRNIWPGDDADTWWSQANVEAYLIRNESHDGQLLDEFTALSGSVSGPLQSYLWAEVSRESQFFDGILHEDLDDVAVYFEVQPTGKLRLELFGRLGEAVDFTNNQEADELVAEASVETKVGRHLNLQLDHALQRLEDDDGELFTANLTQLRAVYNFSTRMFARAILQYRDVSRDPTNFVVPVEPELERLFSQLLFSYKLNPQTVLFVGYSDARLGVQDVSLTQTDRTIFVKLGYAWVL